MTSAQANGGNSSDCNCVQDKIVPALAEDLHVIGSTLATVKQEEIACREILIDVMREGVATTAKLKGSQDDKEKKKLQQRLFDISAKKHYFEEKLSNLEFKAQSLFVQQARLKWRKEQALNHVNYH